MPAGPVNLKFETQASHPVSRQGVQSLVPQADCTVSYREVSHTRGKLSHYIDRVQVETAVAWSVLSATSKRFSFVLAVKQDKVSGANIHAYSVGREPQKQARRLMQREWRRQSDGQSQYREEHVINVDCVYALPANLALQRQLEMHIRNGPLTP